MEVYLWMEVTKLGSFFFLFEFQERMWWKRNPGCVRADRRGAPCVLYFCDGNPCFGVRGENRFSTARSRCCFGLIRKEERKMNNSKGLLKMVVLSMLVALGVVISPLLRVEGMCPMAHFINIVCSVFLGPWYSLLCAVLIGVIRMLTMVPKKQSIQYW